MPTPQLRGLLRGLGTNVRQRRIRLGLTQAELAESVGLEPTYLQKIEYGTSAPSLAALSRLAEVLETDVWRLLKPGAVANPAPKRGRPRKRRPLG